MTQRIDTVEARSKIKPRTAPYWHKLRTGCHLGYRKMAATSAGTWFAQAYDPATRKQTRRSLGAFDELAPSARFDAATKAADAWFAHLDKGGTTETVSVKRACELYVAHVREQQRADAAKDLGARFARWVDDDKIGAIELQKLTRLHVDAWRKKLAATPVTINPHADEKKTRKRSPSSLNRDMTALRAALNFAHDSGHVTSDFAWRVALRPIENADGRRDAYLDRSQRKALIEKAPADLAQFLKALAVLPLRPGALAHLTVGHYDKRRRVLTIGKDKAGHDRRIMLPPSTGAMLDALSKDKLPGAPLLARADGKPWNKDAWKGPVKDAALAAELPPAVTAYALRHSAITDLVTGGLDLLTVAQLSGTSVAMIEKHYGHLRADHAALALAALEL